MNKKTLKDVSVLITKGTTPTSIGGSFTDKGIIFVKSESITHSKYLNSDIFGHIDYQTDEKLKRSRLEEKDLLFSIAGAYLGKIAIVQKSDVPSNTNQAVGIVRLNHKLVDVDYIYYYFSQNHINEYINKLSSQSSQPNLNLEQLGNLEFEYLNLQDQQKIASLLSTLDAKIELNNKINTELEAMAKTLYDYWFVQFDFPNGNGKPYKSSGGKMVWNEDLKREIPEGWEVKMLKEIFNYLEGPGITKEKYTNKGHKFINIKCIQENDLEIDNASMIQEKYISQYSHFLLKENDIVVSTSGTLGRSAVVRNCHLPLLLNTSVIRFRPQKEIYYSYMYFYLKSDVFVNNLYKYATGSIQKNFGPTHLDQMAELFPSDEIFNQFNEKSSPIISKINILRDENQTLAQLRDFLLPMLMNGQVVIR